MTILRMRHTRLGLGLVLAVTACGEQRGAIHVQVSLARQALAGLEITALPFDPERLLDSLDTLAPTPKPTFPELEQELADFVPPDLRRFSAAAAPWRALRDSVADLAGSLGQIDRRSTEYASLYARFRTMYARLAQYSADRDRAVRELRGADRNLTERVRVAAESLRAWEETAYARYPALAASEQLRAGRAAHQSVTDSAGAAHLTLEPGDWWLVARAPVASNPFQEYRWNVRVRLTGWLPVKVPLFEGNRERQWRH
jgi:hypothetical protein